jgi:hypothetical protein
LSTAHLHRLLIQVRAGVLPAAAVEPLGRASPFGSVVTGSLGLPSGLPFADWRAGFPDMSRSAAVPRGTAGQVVLTRQGISLGPVTNRVTLVTASGLDWPHGQRVGHFCRPLHVAMQPGPYLPSQEQTARRMVSEGSIRSDDFPADCPHRTHFHCPGQDE